MQYICDLFVTILSGPHVQRPCEMGDDIPSVRLHDDVGHAPTADGDAREADGAVSVQCPVLLCGAHDEAGDPAPRAVCCIGRVVQVHPARDTH